MKGKVYLVGAGPGHPGLITFRGVECLRRADAVLYDYLCNPVILLNASPNAELICLGRHRRKDVWSQQSINQELVRRALQGQRVVRLKGGDPMIFGRATEELKALVDHDVPFEIVPGVTAGTAAVRLRRHTAHRSAPILGGRLRHRAGVLRQATLGARLPGPRQLSGNVGVLHGCDHGRRVDSVPDPSWQAGGHARTDRPAM